MKSQKLAASFVLVALAASPLALAQNAAKPKKGTKKPAASASASVSAAPEAAPDPPPPPPPPPDTTVAADVKPPPPPPPEKVWDSTDTREDPSKRYYFVGLRYRGDVLPKFLLDAFVDGGKTIYSNAVGVELDSRKDGFSTVFGLMLQNYNTGDMLFLQKGKPQVDNNYSVVNSSLNALYASVDLLWSVPMDTAHHWDFEYGLGVGLGVVFGSLHDNWVSLNPNGQYYDPVSNQHFSQCPKATNDGTGCDPNAHTDPTPAKVANYAEPAGIGGPKPILFPMINFPQLGLRYKPVKEFEARLGLGFSLTGFWFGISGDYGLESLEDHKAVEGHPAHPDRTDGDTPEPKKDSGMPTPRGML
jgi:hypothetical protein